MNSFSECKCAGQHLFSLPLRLIKCIFPDLRIAYQSINYVNKICLAM